MNLNVLAVVAATGLVSVASADVLLDIDLSVANQITITSTGGLSSADATASNFTGFLLADFYNDAAATPSDLSASGDLSTAANASDGSPDIFSGSTSVGFNIWSFSTDSNVSVTAGAAAFAGSSTWTVDAADYADMLAGNISGDIYFDADTDDDIAAGATLIGSWRVVPAPSSLALIGLGGLVAGRRRR
ncbi:MAG: PEP-CTERM sorting domain-containing protein [Phycisphaerales bacterium]